MRMNFRMRVLATSSPDVRVCRCHVLRNQCIVTLLSPSKNGCATGNRPMATVPLGILHGFLSGFPLPLGTLGAVRVHESLRHSHVAGEVAMTTQP